MRDSAVDRFLLWNAADRIRSHQLKLSLPDPALACGILKIRVRTPSPCGRDLSERVLSSVDDCVFRQQGVP